MVLVIVSDVIMVVVFVMTVGVAMVMVPVMCFHWLSLVVLVVVTV